MSRWLSRGLGVWKRYRRGSKGAELETVASLQDGATLTKEGNARLVRDKGHATAISARGGQYPWRTP